MTILVSSVSQDLIVMLSDSTITTTHVVDEQGNYFNEYETGSKFFTFPGVGCITTWGDHTYNRLGSFLQGQRISANTHSVEDLAALAHRYVVEEYRKDETDEVGYHIGGFDRGGRPHLYHAFWGFDRPKPEEQTSPTDRFYEHSDWVFLYNGRNDLAHIVITTLMKQIERGEDTRFDLRTPIGLIGLCDFVARFAAEMTPQVGPPFVIHLVFPDNSIEKIENTSFSPISIQSMAAVLPKLHRQKSTALPRSPAVNPYQGGTMDYILPSGIRG